MDKISYSSHAQRATDHQRAPQMAMVAGQKSHLTKISNDILREVSGYLDVKSNYNKFRATSQFYAKWQYSKTANRMFLESKVTARLISRQYLKNEALQKISVAHARAGDFPAAIATAEQCNHEHACLARSLIAVALAKAEKHEDALAQFNLAMHAAAGSNEAYMELNLLCEIAVIQAKSGMKVLSMSTLQLAQQKYERLKYPFNQLGVAYIILDAQTRAGFWSLAKETISSPIFGRGHDHALSKIALAEAESGNYEGAENTLLRIIDPGVKIKTLVGMADCHIKNKHFAEASASLTKAKKLIQPDIDSEEIDLLLTEIGSKQVEAGLLDEAYLTASEIDGGSNRCKVLSALVCAMFDCGRIDDANKIIKELTEIIDKTTNPNHKNIAIKFLATAQLKLGRLDDAKSSAYMATDFYTTVDILVDIACYRMKNGFHTTGIQGFADAREFINDLPPEVSKSRCCYYIAVAQAKAWLFNEAKKTALSMPDSDIMSEALHAIAIEQADAAAILINANVERPFPVGLP